MRTLLNWLALPDTTSRWINLGALQLGAFLGWVTTPAIWVFAGPFRWAAMVGGLASAESAYDRDAVGDLGLSVGILQFGKGMWIAASGTDPWKVPSGLEGVERAPLDSYQDDDPRFSPFQSGVVAAKYVQIALVNTPRWWTFILPVYGFAVLRYMWTCGVDERCAGRPAFDDSKVPSGALRGKWDRMIGEGTRASGAPTRGFTAFIAWRVILLPLELPLLVWGTGTTIKQLLKEAA